MEKADHMNALGTDRSTCCNLIVMLDEDKYEQVNKTLGNLFCQLRTHKSVISTGTTAEDTPLAESSICSKKTQ